MKTVKWTILVLALAILGSPGCKKKDDTPPTPSYGDVPIDIPKLQQAFADAPPETLNDVTMVGFGVRYGDPVKSLMALEKLTANPSLTEPQKKIVAEVTEQVKTLAAKTPPAPAPAQ